MWFIMSLKRFSTSDGFFDCLEPMSSPDVSGFLSGKGRGLALLNFFEKLLIVPLAFIYKLGKTFFSILGLGLSIVCLAATLCSVSRARKFFVEKISNLVKDLTDWLFWPIGVLFCLGRLALASTLHPALYFRS
jgi:hypothetical protein